jgi:glycosyltransferase involved in cell wall biosynthesis
MQKTDFAFEVVIHDDASNDGTKEIIEEYSMRYPQLFVPMYQTENQFSKGVRGMMIRFNFPRCRGKYIALCEGDDYWTDPLKLQKQVDFLEKHEDYVICYHNASIVDQAGNKVSDSKLPTNSKKDYSEIELIVQMPFILTLSVCFRNVIKEFPEEFRKVLNGDSFLFSLLGAYGKGKYMADIEPAVYRQHQSSIWSSLSTKEQKLNFFNTTYWLAQYYLRIGRDDYAHFFFRDMAYQVQNMDASAKTPGYLKSVEKIEKFILWFTKVSFYYLYKLLTKLNPQKKSS